MGTLAERRKRIAQNDAAITKATRGVVGRVAALAGAAVEDIFAASTGTGTVEDAITAYRNGVIVALTESMLAAYGLAMVEATRDVAKQFATAQQAAIESAQKFLGITDAELEALAEQFGEYAVRIYAEDYAGGDRAIEDALRRTVVESVQAGDHVSAGKARLAETFDSLGISPAHSGVIETVFRTQTQIAYSAGQSAIDKLPVIDEILWGYEYVAVGDNQTRPNHLALDGLRAPKDDPRWASITPSNGWGCRCTVLRIYVDDPEAVAFDPPPLVIEDSSGQQRVVPRAPDPGFDFRPGDVVGSIRR